MSDIEMSAPTSPSASSASSAKSSKLLSMARAISRSNARVEAPAPVVKAQPDVYVFLDRLREKLPERLRDFVVLLSRRVTPLYSCTQPFQHAFFAEHALGNTVLPLHTPRLMTLKFTLAFRYTVTFPEYQRLCELLQTLTHKLCNFAKVTPLPFRNKRHEPPQIHKLLLGCFDHPCTTCNDQPELVQLGVCPECDGTRFVSPWSRLSLFDSLPLARVAHAGVEAIPLIEECNQISALREWLVSTRLLIQHCPFDKMTESLAQYQKQLKKRIQDPITQRLVEQDRSRRECRMWGFKKGVVHELSPALHTALRRALGKRSLEHLLVANKKLILTLNNDDWFSDHTETQPHCSAKTTAVVVDHDKDPVLYCRVCKMSKAFVLSTAILEAIRTELTASLST